MAGKYWTPDNLGQINPVSGCTKISEGCANCYACREHTLHHAGGNGRGFFSRPFDEQILQPSQLKKFDQLRKTVEPHVVFVGNMADLFQDPVPYKYIGEVFEKTLTCPQHTFLFLTKRAQRMRDFIIWYIDEHDFDWPSRYPNVWLGVTAENQERADERIPLLLDTPAKHRFISAEPLLGPINLKQCRYQDIIDVDALDGRCGVYHPGTHPAPAKLELVIAGGESGASARPSQPEWFMDLATQCENASVRYYHKQNGDAFKYGPSWGFTNAEYYEQPFIGRHPA